MSAQIITDEHGRILDVCPNTAGVLNVSARGVLGRPLPLFVEQDRPALFRQLDAAARGHVVVMETVLRPRERHSRKAILQIARVGGKGLPVELQWWIELV